MPEKNVAGANDIATVTPSVASAVPHKIVPRRYIGRWIATAIVTVLAAAMLVNVFTNKHFGWDVVWMFLRDVQIGRGIWTTIWLTVAATFTVLTSPCVRFPSRSV